MSCLPDDRTVASDEEVMVGCKLLTYFQPICSVKTRSIVGIEALTRGVDASGTLLRPDLLFAEAAEQGIAGPWEMRCREQCVATYAKLAIEADSPLLFLNINLASTGGEDDVARLVETARQHLVPTSSIVVEVLESRFDDTQRLADILKRFRDQGFLLALDDVGAGHSNLDRVPLIHPDILKIDRELLQHIDSDCYKQGVFKSLVDLGRRIGALVVAEGVETEPEAIMALELGADFLQGFGVCRPQPPERLLFNRIRAVVEVLARQFKTHMVRKTNERRLQHRQYNVLINTLLCDLTCSPSADFTAVLKQAIQRFPCIECVYVLDETGIQVSDTICRDEELGKHCRAMFRPAPRGSDSSLKEYYYMLLDAELQKYTTEPYVSLATGNLCQTISTCFRDGFKNRLYVLCVDIKAGS